MLITLRRIKLKSNVQNFRKMDLSELFSNSGWLQASENRLCLNPFLYILKNFQFSLEDKTSKAEISAGKKSPSN